MKLFKDLNPSLKIAVLTYIIAIVGFLITLFLIFNGHQDIPLGILFAGGVVGTVNLFAGLAERFTKDKEGAIISIVLVGIRTFLVLGVMIFVALMYYRWNMPYFNIFAYVAVYTISIILTIIVNLKERK